MNSQALIIFDLDGTLLHSEHVAREAFMIAYRAANMSAPAPLEAFIDRMGDSLSNILNHLQLPAQMAEHFREAAKALDAQLALKDGAFALLEELAAEGYVLALLTGKDRQRTDTVLEQFGIRSFFAAVCAGDDGPAPKPSAEGIHYLRAQTRCQDAPSIMIGDSPLDLLAAKNARVRTIACFWGASCAAKLSSVGADAYAVHPREVRVLVEQVLAREDDAMRLSETRGLIEELPGLKGLA